MKIISHRGLLYGPDKFLENKSLQVDLAINHGFDVEIDIHSIDGCLYLGHDNPSEKISIEWLNKRSQLLWVHLKNIEAAILLQESNLNYFWHEKDKITITKSGHYWVYPGYQPIPNSIAVLPEIHSEKISQCWGICTDYPMNYKNNL